MPHPRRLIPLLVTALVIQGLVGVVPHTHRTGGLEAEVARADSGLITIYETDESAHDCLACSVHAPMVEAAASRGIVHGVEQAYSAPVIQWSISILSPHRTANPRAPPRIV